MSLKGYFPNSLVSTTKENLLLTNHNHLDSTFAGQELSSMDGSIRNSSSPSEFKPKKG